LQSSQKIVAQPFQRVLLQLRPKSFAEFNPGNATGAGAEYDQAAGDFSAKGQMI